jgi:hypothetical protein
MPNLCQRTFHTEVFKILFIDSGETVAKANMGPTLEC